MDKYEVTVRLPGLGVTWRLGRHPVVRLLALCAKREAEAHLLGGVGERVVGLLGEKQCACADTWHRCHLFLSAMESGKDFKIVMLEEGTGCE